MERRLIEDEERRTREVTQFYKKEAPKWDVVIRSHGVPEEEAWERGEFLMNKLSLIFNLP